MFLPIPAENQPGLTADLEGNPFVGHALSSATCEHRCPVVINDGNQADGGEPQTVPVERPAETALLAEPAHVKRVTEKKAKDPKKVAAGRAGAAARQKRLL